MIGQSVNMMYSQTRADFPIPRPAFEPAPNHIHHQHQHHHHQHQLQQQQHQQESHRQFELAIRLQEAQRMRLINRQLERFQTLKTSTYEDNTDLFHEKSSRTLSYEQGPQKNLDITPTADSTSAPSGGNCFYTPPSSSASPISPPLPVQLEESNSIHHSHHHHHHHHQQTEIHNDGLVSGRKHPYQDQMTNESSPSTSSQAGLVNRRSSSIRNRPKRVRTIFTPEQLRYLEMSFADEIYISGQDRALLSAMLNLTEPQVKVWFQNRRIKHRKLTDTQPQGITKGNKSFKAASRPKKETT